jgi:hypothetical protein
MARHEKAKTYPFDNAGRQAAYMEQPATGADGCPAAHPESEPGGRWRSSCAELHFVDQDPNRSDRPAAGSLAFAGVVTPRSDPLREGGIHESQRAA